MAYGQDKYQAVESLLEAGVSVRQAAEQSSCSLTFVKKVRAAIKDRLPKSKQGGARKSVSKKTGSSGLSKPVSAPNKKKTQKDTSLPPDPPKTAWEAVSEQKEHKKTQARPLKAPPPEADLNLTPEQIDIEHKNAVRQVHPHKRGE